MIAPLLPIFPRRIARGQILRWIRPAVNLLTFLAVFPALAHAQSGSPFDTGFTAMQTLFTGTVAKVASLIAIVVGGYQFAHGEPGAKKLRCTVFVSSPGSSTIKAEIHREAEG